MALTVAGGLLHLQVLLLYYLGHVLGCVFWHLATLDRDNSWVAAFDPDGSWGARGESLWDQSVRVQYLVALYWALTTLTTVGYGDITPRTESERGFALIVLLIACLVYGVFVGEVSSLARSLDRHATLKREHLDVVKDYTAWRGLDAGLRRRVREHYERSLALEPLALDEVKLLSGLPTDLREEVRAELAHAPPSAGSALGYGIFWQPFEFLDFGGGRKKGKRRGRAVRLGGSGGA